MFASIAILIEKHSETESLLALAARLARACAPSAAAISLLSVREPTPWYSRFLIPNADEVEHAANRVLEARLGQLAATLQGEGFEVSTSVLAGKVSIEAARACADRGVGLLIKQIGTEDHESASAVDLQVLRQAPCAVLMVKRALGAGFPSRVLAAVAPAVSPSEADVLNLHEPPDLQRLALNQRVLASARAMAKMGGAEVHVAHAWHVPGEGLLRSEPLLSAQQIRDYVESLRVAHEGALARFLQASPEVVARENVHLVKGGAAAVLCDLVKRLRVDLVVLGTVVRSGMPGFLLGSTTESIARDAPCSILALKPDDFVSPAVDGGA